MGLQAFDSVGPWPAALCGHSVPTAAPEQGPTSGPVLNSVIPHHPPGPGPGTATL